MRSHKNHCAEKCLCEDKETKVQVSIEMFILILHVLVSVNSVGQQLMKGQCNYYICEQQSSYM